MSNPSGVKGPGGSLVDVHDIQVTDLDKVRREKDEKTKAKTTKVGGQNIVTVEVPKQQTISSFSPGALKDQKGIRYSDVKAGIADPTIRKNSRFRINELSRGPMSVEQEEQEQIEQEVQARLGLRVAQIQDEAHKKGLEAGRKQGQDLAREEFLAAAKPHLEKFEKLVACFENASHDVFVANEAFLIHLVSRLAKSVILKELKDDTDYTRRLILQLLDRVGVKENVKIFVSQEAFSAAEQIKQGLAQSLGQLKNVTIELDSEIRDRGCRLETEFGEVDARIDVQIESIGQTLGPAKH